MADETARAAALGPQEDGQKPSPPNENCPGGCQENPRRNFPPGWTAQGNRVGQWPRLRLPGKSVGGQITGDTLKITLCMQTPELRAGRKNE